MWRILAGLCLAVVMLGAAAATLNMAYQKGDKAGWDRRDAVAWQSAAKNSETARQVERVAAAAAATVDAQHEQAAQQIRTVYRTIERERAVYVTPEIDRRFPLSVGWVRLHDAAALGVPAGSLTDPAGLVDDGPSTVVASAAADTIRANYEACTDTGRKLTDLQALIRGQAGWPR